MAFHLPQTKVSSFYINPICSFLYQVLDSAQWSTLTGIKVGEELSGLILSAFSQNILTVLGEVYPEGTKAGGHISSPSDQKKIIYSKDGIVNKGTCVITFSGNVQLHVEVVNGKHTEKVLSTFPQNVKYLAGILFTCVGRGTSFHERKNAEVNAFKKYFPNIPISGFFTGGEFAQKSGEEVGGYSYSSIFCLLSLKP